MILSVIQSILKGRQDEPSRPLIYSEYKHYISCSRYSAKLICRFHVLFLHFEFFFSHVSLRLADANAVESMIVIVFPWNSGPLCFAQSGMIYHFLSGPFSFCTCAPSSAASKQVTSLHNSGHESPLSLNFSQCAFHDPHLHLFFDVPLRL